MELKMLQITKDYKEVRAVNNISYTFTNGVYGLLGVNGAGKTTLMRILCTLLKPTSGSVLWDGKEIFAMDGEYRRLLGYLPQDFGFYPEFTVSDYLKYIASIKELRVINDPLHLIVLLIRRILAEPFIDFHSRT